MKPSSSSTMKLSLSALPARSDGSLGSFPEPVWKALLAQLSASSPGDLKNMASLNKELSCLVREVRASTPRLHSIRARPTSARIHKRQSAHRRTISSVISAQQKMPKTELNESLKNVARGCSPASPPPQLADRSILKPPRLKSAKKKKKKHSAKQAPSVQIIPPEVTTSFLKYLHEEANLYASAIRESVAKSITPKAESMTRRIELLTKYLWNNAHVEVYGSMATGLALPTSDLDLCIVGATLGPNGETPFDMLVRELRKQPWLDLHSFQPVGTARTPVIKLTSTIESLPTDITFCDYVYKRTPSRRSFSNQFLPGYFHRGLQSRDLVREYVKRLPSLVPLVLVLKQLIGHMGLNNAFQGGLSSFALVLMVVSFLQLHSHDTAADQPSTAIILSPNSKLAAAASQPNNDTSKSAESEKKNRPKPMKGTRVGDLLFRLLRHYAQLDYHTTGIDVTGGREFEITQSEWDAFGCIPPAVILDPTAEQRINLTQNAFAIHRIKNVFLCAYEYLLRLSKEPQFQPQPGVHPHHHSNYHHKHNASAPLAHLFTAVQESSSMVSPRPSNSLSMVNSSNTVHQNQSGPISAAPHRSGSPSSLPAPVSVMITLPPQAAAV